MDGHFVPNLTFGAKTIKALRRADPAALRRAPDDREPGRFIDEYLDAGCDSVTIHVEIDERSSRRSDAIRAAGRAAGCASSRRRRSRRSSRTGELLDIVMVMTVEPGFGGQAFMADVAKAKLFAGARVLSHKLHGGEVHVDGGVNRETAELVGGLGVDILVVGSALWIKGRDMGREIRLIRALADEGYQYALNDGVPPIPRDRWSTLRRSVATHARTLRDEIETAGIPVLLFRSRDDPAEMARRGPPLGRAAAGLRGGGRARRAFARRRDPSGRASDGMRAPLLQRVEPGVGRRRR